MINDIVSKAYLLCFWINITIRIKVYRRPIGIHLRIKDTRFTTIFLSEKARFILVGITVHTNCLLIGLF